MTIIHDLLGLIEAEEEAQRERDEHLRNRPIKERVALGEALSGLTCLGEEVAGIYRLRSERPNFSKFYPGRRLHLYHPDFGGHHKVDVVEVNSAGVSIKGANGSLPRNALHIHPLGWNLESYFEPLFFDLQRKAVLRLDENSQPLLWSLLARLPLKGTLEPERIEPPSDLNESQRRAFEGALGVFPVTLVHGPPGTGKTHLLAKMAGALRARGRRILITAFTNRAVDRIVEKLILHTESVRRLGRLEAIDHAVKNFHNGFDASDSCVYASTLYGALQLPANHFDYVFLDEASQVLTSVALCGLLAGNRMVVFGDHHQLPPIMSCRTDSGFARSFFEICLDQVPSFMLEDQYRMCSEICAPPSTVFYQGRLKPANPEVANRRLKVSALNDTGRLRDALEPDHPVVFIEHHSEGLTNNIIEAEIVAHLVGALLQSGVAPEEIGIVSFFRSQLRSIANQLESPLLHNDDSSIWEKLSLDTAERFQGNEREVMILALTSDTSRNIEEGFIFSPNRLNVAATRARSKLIIVGNPNLFRLLHPKNDAEAKWKALITHLYEKGHKMVWEGEVESTVERVPLHPMVSPRLAHSVREKDRNTEWTSVVIEERGTPIRKRYAGLVRLLADHIIQDKDEKGRFEIHFAIKGAQSEVKKEQLRDLSPAGAIPRRMVFLAAFYSQFLERPLQLRFTTRAPKGCSECESDCIHPPWLLPTKPFCFLQKELANISGRTRQKHDGREHQLVQRLLNKWETGGEEFHQCEISFEEISFNYDLFLESLDGSPTFVEVETASAGRDVLSNLGALAWLELGISLLRWRGVSPEGRLILEDSRRHSVRCEEFRAINDRLAAKGGPRILVQTEGEIRHSESPVPLRITRLHDASRLALQIPDWVHPGLSRGAEVNIKVDDKSHDKIRITRGGMINTLRHGDPQVLADWLSRNGLSEGDHVYLVRPAKKPDGWSFEMSTNLCNESERDTVPIMQDKDQCPLKEAPAEEQNCHTCGYTEGVRRFCPRCGSLNRRYQLVIISCVQSKIWSQIPGTPKYVAAKDAYVSPYFTKMKTFAELYGEQYLILSARYGLLEPDHPISDYEVTFRDSKTGPICEETLRRQVLHQERFGQLLGNFRDVCITCGSDYEEPLRQTFQALGAQVSSPLQGLRLGEKMKRLDELIKRAKGATVGSID